MKAERKIHLAVCSGKYLIQHLKSLKFETKRSKYIRGNSTQDNCKKFDDKYFCIRSPVEGIELEQTKNYEDKIY